MMWNFEDYDQNPAVISEDGSILTYRDLKKENEALKSVIPDRCLVFSLCRNCAGSMIGYTSFINNGTVPLLLDSHLDRELLVNLIQTYQPDYLWIPEDLQTEFVDYHKVYGTYSYILLKTTYQNVYQLNEDLALLLTTSGSTGSPKLVRQSYQNLRANMDSIAQYLEIDSSERPITTLPMNYTYGLSVVNSHLFKGAALIMTEKGIMQKEFWNQLKEYGATSIAGVPYTYEMLNKLRFFRMDLPSLRTMTQAGGKLSPELHKAFAEYAINSEKRFFVMYGQTEATARMAYLPYQKSLEKYGSMGIAIPNGRFELVDVNGDLITEPDVVGELLYYGDNVTLGYAERGEDLLKGDERQGVLMTGDMAKQDEEGYFYIVGRKKRFLKLFGNRVNLDETERMLKARFDQADIACAGFDDNMYIFVTDEKILSEVRQYAAEKTGINPIAFIVRPIDSIPKNEVGKTLYAKLERFYDELQ